ncbi:hypothetical protein ASG16_019420 [Brevibacillus sp. Leaf182]|nr:hypothetical protein ASG16_019420 [Brevibacillus sp. Leaf182]
MLNDFISITYIAPIIVLLTLIFSMYKYRFVKYNTQNAGISGVAIIALLTLREKDFYSYSMAVIFMILLILFLINKKRHSS